MKRIVLLFGLAACVLSAPAAMAQSNLGLKRVGGALAFVSPESLNETISIGIFADHGTIAPNLALESRIDYWGQSEQVFGAKASTRDIAVGARGKYGFALANPSVRPFAGAGLGLHFLRSEVVIPAQGGFPAMTAEASTTKLGIDLGGGIATQLNPRWDFLGEAWFGIVDSASQFSLRAGLSYALGQ